jgi:acetyl-CoA carboxylase biotin carboxyl carrier protein
VTDNTTPSWQDLLDLVTQLDSGSYDSASVAYGNISVQLSRSGPLAAPVATVPAAVIVPALAPTPTPASASPTATTPEPSGTTIPSPMIGVFYRCPSPGASPFVEPGARVEPDTTIGIIEVMKLMNPVTAGVAGTITSFLVKDNEQVEYGQALAVVSETGAP